MTPGGSQAMVKGPSSAAVRRQKRGEAACGAASRISPPGVFVSSGAAGDADAKMSEEMMNASSADAARLPAGALVLVRQRRLKLILSIHFIHAEASAMAGR